MTCIEYVGVKMDKSVFEQREHIFYLHINNTEQKNLYFPTCRLQVNTNKRAYQSIGGT